MIQSATASISTRLSLQPGDGTKYDFFYIDLGEPCETVWYDPEDNTGDTVANEWSPTLRKAFWRDSVTIGIINGRWQGVCEVNKALLVDLKPLTVKQVAYWMNMESSLGTVAAVLLAVGALIDNPGNLEGACQAMLKAPDLL